MLERHDPAAGVFAQTDRESQSPVRIPREVVAGTATKEHVRERDIAACGDFEVDDLEDRSPALSWRPELIAADMGRGSGTSPGLRAGRILVSMSVMSDPSTYRERTSAVAGVTVWTRVADGSSSWILPDGCIDVLWNGRELAVAGPDTTAHRASAPNGTPFVAVRFASGVAPTVLGVAADGLRDQRPCLADVIGADDSDRLAESLLATDHPSRALERWAGRRLAHAGGRDRTMCRVAALIGDGRTVADVAAQAGFSERQLNRRSLASFGYGPKVLARVLRLQRAVGLARGGMSLVQAALAAGYADQAHFAHEVRALTGQSASQLVGSAANRSTPLPSGSRNVA